MPGNGVTSSLSENNFLLLSSMDAGQCRQISSDSLSLSLFLSFSFSLSLSLSLSLALALLSTFLSTKPCQTLIINSPSLSAAISTNREQERDTHTSRDVPWALGLFAGMRQCFQTSKAYSCEPAALCKSSDTLMPPDSRQEGGETDCV